MGRPSACESQSTLEATQLLSFWVIASFLYAGERASHSPSEKKNKFEKRGTIDRLRFIPFLRDASGLSLLFTIL